MNYKLKIMNVKLSNLNFQLLTMLIAALFALPVKAQVEIGDNTKNPQTYSLMEVATSRNQGGLRLPQLKTAERDALNAGLIANPDAAQGLVIFNIETYCIEYWSVDHWVSLCNNGAKIFFTNPGADPRIQSNWVDPTAVPFPAADSTAGPYVPHDTPECTSATPPYTLTVKVGAAYASVATANPTTGAFTIRMTQNTAVGTRYAIVNVKDNCTNQSEDFLFTQAGACTSLPDQPGIITGDTVVGVNNTGYNNAGLTYSVTNVPGVTYTWLLPAGWIQTAGGTTNSITVNVGPTRGTGTITVIPSNTCGNGAPSTLTVRITCGAYLSASATQWKEFMCWNLGANYAVDPFEPSADLNGDYYIWGSPTPAGTRDSIIFNGNITWNSTTVPDNVFGIYGDGSSVNINDTVKSATDPCPTGYRVPSAGEFYGVISGNPFYNKITYKGPWGTASDTNWSGIMFGNSLFCPAAGFRNFFSIYTGSLSDRGNGGYYLNTAFNRTGGMFGGYPSPYVGYINNQGSLYYGANYYPYAYSVRCIAQ